MKYLYTLAITILFLVGYLLIDYINPLFRSIYATCVVAFLSFVNFIHYAQKRQQ